MFCSLVFTQRLMCHVFYDCVVRLIFYCACACGVALVVDVSVCFVLLLYVCAYL